MTQEELYEKYPNLFARKDLPKYETCMCWGIAVGAGWMSLIDDMSAEITTQFPDVQYEQIKEKFGALRVYTHETNEDNRDAVYSIISRYEALSQTVCETCGEPGEIRTNGWRVVACDEHNKEDTPEHEV